LGEGKARPGSSAAMSGAFQTLKRHDDVVHDVDEVWRCLRRTMIFLHTKEIQQAESSLRFTLGIFNLVDDIDLVTKSHLCCLFAELYHVFNNEDESNRLYDVSLKCILQQYGNKHLVMYIYQLIILSTPLINLIATGAE
jgi:hypothetical protein